MKLINVLILGVGGNVSQGIMAAIKNSELNCRIIGTCISAESLGLYFCDTAYVVPYANDPLFLDAVIDICNKESIDIILTGVEENIMALESNRIYLESNTNALFISSTKKQLNIGINKYQTAEWLKQNGCNYPKSANAFNWREVEDLVADIGFPLIAKPNAGKGSSGIFIANNWNDLNKIKNTNYCVQELIGDSNSEYTVACYVDKHGDSKDILIMHRRLKSGTTFMAEIIQDDSIAEECRKICKAFSPKGPLNIQLRLHNGKPVCFELNVRFSGTAPIRAHWGYNDVEALIREYILDESVVLKPVSKGKVYRYYNEAFIDVDMQKKLEINRSVQNVKDYNNYIETK